MSKKHKRKQRPKSADAASLPVLAARVARAITELRFQQGLELAKALCKQEPSEAHKELLRQAALGRARQLRAQGHTRDASAVLENVAGLGGGPAFLADLAQELAACGNVRRGLDLAARLPDPELQSRVLAQAADAALRQGPAGRDLLPPSLQGQFDLVLRAFTQAEAGQDEPARETLQGIGLQSPFLEWKLLLRGLLAYYQNDDARAVENWQRLRAERWPARLAAPFRCTIDRDFRAAQPPATQTALQQQADQLQGVGLVASLRTLQAALNNEKQLPQAFRLAETLVGALRREAPALVGRLASCFYWAILHHGMPEDLPRYKRVFGTPADDPQLARLAALGFEQRGQMQEAHHFWQVFEESVAGNPAWPAGQAARVRALVWCHMGQNADDMPDLGDLSKLPPFLRDHPDRPRPLKPSAEECYQRSLELAPDQLDTYEALFQHHQQKKHPAKAEKAARRLLEHFPEHAPTLEALGDLRMQARDYAEALALYQRALKVNPLDRRLRAAVANAHSYNARGHAEAGRFAEARAEYQSALALDEGRERYPVLCKWAACEFKAGDAARAEELLQQAHAEQGHPLAVAFSMLIEVIRLKLPRTLKTRFDREVNALLAAPPTPGDAAAIATTVAAHRGAGVTYLGQKTHEKKVLAYLDRARTLPFSEQQLAQICLALRIVQAVRLRLDYIRRGQEQFPDTPFFFLAEAEHDLAQGPQRCSPWRLRQLLERARELAQAMPRDERQQEFLERIQQLEHEVRLLNPFAALFGDGGPFDPFDLFADEEDYDDDEGW